MFSISKIDKKDYLENFIYDTYDRIINNQEVDIGNLSDAYWELFDYILPLQEQPMQDNIDKYQILRNKLKKITSFLKNNDKKFLKNYKENYRIHYFHSDWYRQYNGEKNLNENLHPDSVLRKKELHYIRRRLKTTNDENEIEQIEDEKIEKSKHVKQIQKDTFVKNQINDLKKIEDLKFGYKEFSEKILRNEIVDIKTIENFIIINSEYMAELRYKNRKSYNEFKPFMFIIEKFLKENDENYPIFKEKETNERIKAQGRMRYKHSPEYRERNRQHVNKYIEKQKQNLEKMKKEHPKQYQSLMIEKEKREKFNIWNWFLKTKKENPIKLKAILKAWKINPEQSENDLVENIIVRIKQINFNKTKNNTRNNVLQTNSKIKKGIEMNKISQRDEKLINIIRHYLKPTLINDAVRELSERISDLKEDTKENCVEYLVKQKLGMSEQEAYAKLETSELDIFLDKLDAVKSESKNEVNSSIDEICSTLVAQSMLEHLKSINIIKEKLNGV